MIRVGVDVFKGRIRIDISKYKNWGYDPRVDKTVTKIPMYIKYAMKECA